MKIMVKPILFNTEMVRAILDGRKTTTRRIVKPQPKMLLSYIFAGDGNGKWNYPPKDASEWWGDKYARTDTITKEDETMKWNPPYHADDILYVRETWNHGYIESSDAECSSEHWFEETAIGTEGYLGAISGFAYKADFSEEDEMQIQLGWKPSIHMPKDAARIWLKVKDVRVERLQDISEEQAWSEGISSECKGCKDYRTNKCQDCANEHESYYDFMSLWDKTINKADIDKYGCEANPYVWVIEFERCDKPEV